MRFTMKTCLAGLALITASTMLHAQAGAPRAVDRLEMGLWEFRDLSGNGRATRHCLMDLRALLQPRQSGPLCRHYISEDGPDRAAVAYDCGNRGQGRTNLRVETARLVQIESQGIVEGRPFSLRLEARRIGACHAESGV